MVVFSGSCMPYFSFFIFSSVPISFSFFIFSSVPFSFSFFIFSSVPFSFFFPESRAQSYGYFPIPPKITLQSYVKFR